MSAIFAWSGCDESSGPDVAFVFDAIESDGIEGDVLEHGLVVRGALGVRLHLVLRFRHLLEQHELCGAMLDVVNLYLDSKGIRISTGTI